jgi:hypothetical protein
MKKKPVITASILALLFSSVLLAQDSNPSGKGWRHNQEHRLANLSPAERQKVEAARQTAMQDPGVRAAREKLHLARKDLHDAMHAAMVKADPTIEPILAKLPKHEHERPDD